jgi:hypothetical protein
MVLLMRVTSGFSIEGCHERRKGEGRNEWPSNREGRRREEEEEERQAVVLMSMGEEARTLFKYLSVKSARRDKVVVREGPKCREREPIWDY